MTNMSPTLMLLKQLQSTASIHLESIGFQWCDWLPYPPAPMDMLPFATTGGDGCYFAFLTDWGYWKNLEETPVVFICPSDFDEQNPHFANKMFARNIRDFLRLMITLPSAEILRFNKAEEVDYDTEITTGLIDLAGISASFMENRQRTIETIKSAFDITEMENIADYYHTLLTERAAHDFLPLRDGLGLKTRLDTSEVIHPDFSNLTTLADNLSKATPLERLIFYREAPYMYRHFQPEYEEVLLIMRKFLDADKKRGPC